MAVAAAGNLLLCADEGRGTVLTGPQQGAGAESALQVGDEVIAAVVLLQTRHNQQARRSPGKKTLRAVPVPCHPGHVQGCTAEQKILQGQSLGVQAVGQNQNPPGAGQ